MTGAFLAALLVSGALRLWLSVRQERHVRAHRDRVPEAFRDTVAPDAHRRAADYTVARQRFGRVVLVVHALLLLGWTLGGGLAWLDARLDGVAFVLAAMFLFELALLPLAAYRTFGLEQRFGFNRTTPRLFLADLVREAAIGLLLGAPLAWGALQLVDRGWWLPLWLGWVGVSMFLAWAWPAWIAPRFWKFTRLDDEALGERVRRLLERTGFSAEGVFVMDGSRRSTRANAYFTGVGRRKRVVLFDTLRQLLDAAEIEAVLAHELGHFRLRHVRAHLVAGALLAAAGIAAFAAVAMQPWFQHGLGAESVSTAMGLVLFLWVAPLFLFPLRPLLAAWSRRHEYAADAFAAEHASARAMAGALVKLHEHNASTLTPDPIHSAWTDTHPPAASRIARLAR